MLTSFPLRALMFFSDVISLRPILLSWIFTASLIGQTIGGAADPSGSLSTTRITVEPTDVLLVVDVQNDFVSGSMAIADAKSIIPVINRLAEKFEHVILTQDWHPAGHVSFASAHPGAIHGGAVTTAYGLQRVFNDHCVQGSQGAEFDPDLRLTKAELVLRKGYRLNVDSFSAFYENNGTTATGLGEYLRARGFKRVFCTGLAMYGCVKASAEGGRRDGFEVFMIDDACRGSTRSAEGDAAAAKSLADKGVIRISSASLLP